MNPINAFRTIAGISACLFFAPAHADAGLLAAAELVTAADYLQTRQIADGVKRWPSCDQQPELLGCYHDWQWPSGRQKEENPVLGHYPNQRRVAAYFAAVAASLVFVNYELSPSHARIALSVYTAFESVCVARNAHLGIKVRF